MPLPKIPIQLLSSRMEQIALVHLQPHVMCTIERLHVVEVVLLLCVMKENVELYQIVISELAYQVLDEHVRTEIIISGEITTDFLIHELYLLAVQG